jgi:hypothetical protein
MYGGFERKLRSISVRRQSVANHALARVSEHDVAGEKPITGIQSQKMKLVKLPVQVWRSAVDKLYRWEEW